MIKKCIAVAVLCLFASQAWAGEILGPQVTAMANAIQARLDAIGAGPDVPKLERREAKKLAKAKKSLDAYKGVDNKADFNKLGKAGKLAYKSGTTDPGILGAVGGFADALLTLVTSQGAIADQLRDLLTTARFTANVDKLIAKAKAAIESARALLDTDPVKAQKLLMKAYLDFVKSELKGRKFLEKEQIAGNIPDGGGSGAIPAGINVFNSFGTTGIINSTGKPFDIKQVALDLTIFYDGEEAERVGAKATDFDPSVFKNWQGRVFPGDWYALTELFPAISFLLPPGVKSVRYQGIFTVTTQQYRKFDVPYDFTYTPWF